MYSTSIYTVAVDVTIGIITAVLLHLPVCSLLNATSSLPVMEVSCAFSHAFENVDNGILWEGAVCLLKGNSHQIISVASMIELHLEHFFSVLLAYIRSQKAG